MLSILRNAAGTWVAKLLLVLLVVSFAVWGISGSLVTGFGSNSVVTAGGTTVSPIEYRLAYDRQIAVMSQQFGTRLTREQAKALGVENQVLAQLVAGAVLDEQASELGLGLSQDKLAQLTMSDPAFQGPNGQFDRQQFEYVLRQIGMRAEDYLQNRGQVAIRQQIVEAVSDGLTAPDTFLRAVALYRGEDRTAEYIVLPKSLVEPIGEPSDAVLSAYFDENKQSYAAPEYRKIAYISLVPENIADEKAISDAQVKEDYDRNITRFTTPETRTIEQLVFPDRKAAEAAVDSIKTGATFDSIVTAQGKTAADTLLGTFAKDKVPDQAVAEAAFALQANQVSPIVDGAFGPVLVRVTAITPAVVKSLAEATPEIRKDLALAEANRILLDVHDSYEDSRAAGESLREAAAKLGLDVVTVEAVDRAGQRPDGSVVNDLPQSKELLDCSLRSRGRHREPAGECRQHGLRLPRGRRHHPCPRAHAGRGEGQGRRRLEGVREREAAGRQGRRCREASEGRRAARRACDRARPREAHQARPEARIRRCRFRPLRRRGDLRHCRGRQRPRGGADQRCADRVQGHGGLRAGGRRCQFYT